MKVILTTLKGPKYLKDDYMMRLTMSLNSNYINMIIKILIVSSV